jgi:hypothetical protein
MRYCGKITNNHKCISTFGTILPCTLLLYAHCLVQTRNDKYLKGPLSLLQARSYWRRRRRRRGKGRRDGISQ